MNVHFRQRVAVALGVLGVRLLSAGALAVAQPSGACCLSGGQCLITTGPDCSSRSGQYRGDNTVCVPNPCSSQPATGACCLPGGSCNEVTPSQCGMQGGAYQGDGTSCTPNPCTPTGACCLSGNTCFITTSPNCSVQGGIYRGDNTVCA